MITIKRTLILSILILTGCAKKDPLMEHRSQIFKEHEALPWFEKRITSIGTDGVEAFKSSINQGAELNGLYTDISNYEKSKMDHKFDYLKDSHNPVKTALQKAIAYNSAKIVRYLLEDLKVDPNEIMNQDLSPIIRADRETPLSHACHKIFYYVYPEYKKKEAQRVKEIVELLLKHGAKIDQSAVINSVESFVDNKICKFGIESENMPYSILKKHKGFDEKAKKAALDEWLSSRMIYLNLAWGKKEWIAFADSHIKDLSNETE